MSDGCWTILARLHSAFAHFPIALLVAALLAEVVGAVRPNAGFDTAGRFCLTLAVLGAIAATVSGFASMAVTFESARSDLLTHHEVLGSAAVVMAVAAWVIVAATKFSITGRLYVVYIVALLISVVLVVATGYTGSVIIHGGIWP